jgi:hypothetical protein
MLTIRRTSPITAPKHRVSAPKRSTHAVSNIGQKVKRSFKLLYNLEMFLKPFNQKISSRDCHKVYAPSVSLRTSRRSFEVGPSPTSQALKRN